MGELCELSARGDTKTIWDPARPDEVENAKNTFDRLKRKGYAAFSVDPKNGEKSTQISEFDPQAGKLIMVPPIAGG